MALIRETWGPSIAKVQPDSPVSNGLRVAHRYGVGGARAEAASGFRAVYEIGLPALREAKMVGWNAAKVHCIFALIANLNDTNLLHRGGPAGLQFAQGPDPRIPDQGRRPSPRLVAPCNRNTPGVPQPTTQPRRCRRFAGRHDLIDLLDPHAISD